MLRSSTNWNDASKVKPRCPRKPHSLGTPVIVYQPGANTKIGERRVFEAYYGKRLSSSPCFYLYGSELHGITHWHPLPKEPK